MKKVARALKREERKIRKDKGIQKNDEKICVCEIIVKNLLYFSDAACIPPKRVRVSLRTPNKSS
jgi:hypothetical protein